MQIRIGWMNGSRLAWVKMIFFHKLPDYYIFHAFSTLIILQSYSGNNYTLYLVHTAYHELNYNKLNAACFVTFTIYMHFLCSTLWLTPCKQWSFPFILLSLLKSPSSPMTTILVNLDYLSLPCHTSAVLYSTRISKAIPAVTSLMRILRAFELLLCYSCILIHPTKSTIQAIQ